MKYSIYTDGSYKDGRYGYAFILIDDHTILYKEGGACEPPFNVQNNIGPEICAVVKGINHAYKSGINTLTIHHDYNGLGHWARGEWKANNELTKRFVKFISTATEKGMSLTFVKVDAHSGIEMNELVDSLARGEESTPTGSHDHKEMATRFINYLPECGYHGEIIIANAQVVRFSVHTNDGDLVGYGNIYYSKTGSRFSDHEITKVGVNIMECWKEFLRIA